MSWDDEERTARVLSTVLRDQPVPAPRSDVARAVRAGRRAERRRQRISAGLAAVAVAVAAGTSAVVLAGDDRVRPEPAAVEPVIREVPPVRVVPVTVAKEAADCRITPLPTPAGTGFARVDTSSPNGRYVLGNADRMPAKPADRTVLVLWDGEVPTVFETPGTGVHRARRVEVNSAGVVVGTDHPVNDPSKPVTAWVYRDGQAHELPAPTGYAQVTAEGVNDRGDVVGVAYRDAARNVGDRVVVVWPDNGKGEPRVLPGSDNVNVIGVADNVNVIGVAGDGTVVGQRDDGLQLWHPDGGREILPMPAGWNALRAMQVRGEWVAGFIENPGKQEGTPPARWNIRTGQLTVYTGLDVQSHFTVWTNSEGRLLVGTPRYSSVLLGEDGTAAPLPLPDDVHEKRRHEVYTASISAGGMVAGGVPPTDRQNRAATWHCR